MFQVHENFLFNLRDTTKVKKKLNRNGKIQTELVSSTVTLETCWLWHLWKTGENPKHLRWRVSFKKSCSPRCYPVNFSEFFQNTINHLKNTSTQSVTFQCIWGILRNFAKFIGKTPVFWNFSKHYFKKHLQSAGYFSMHLNMVSKLNLSGGGVKKKQWPNAIISERRKKC